MCEVVFQAANDLIETFDIFLTCSTNAHQMSKIQDIFSISFCRLLYYIKRFNCPVIFQCIKHIIIKLFLYMTRLCSYENYSRWKIHGYIFMNFLKFVNYNNIHSFQQQKHMLVSELKACICCKLYRVFLAKTLLYYIHFLTTKFYYNMNINLAQEKIDVRSYMITKKIKKNKNKNFISIRKQRSRHKILLY